MNGPMPADGAGRRLASGRSVVRQIPQQELVWATTKKVTTMGNWRLSMVFWLVLFATLFGTTAQASDEAASVVRATTEEVLERVQDKKAELRADPGKMYSLVSEVVFPHFDFDTISTLVLGDHWSDASEAKRQAFVEQFRKLLVRTYATALLELSGERISYPAIEREERGDTATVKQLIAQSGESGTPVLYRLHNTGDGWKVYDVSVDGVSLLKTYRASFGSMIRDGGLDELIASLDSKNQQYGN